MARLSAIFRIWMRFNSSSLMTHVYCATQMYKMVRNGLCNESSCPSLQWRLVKADTTVHKQLLCTFITIMIEVAGEHDSRPPEQSCRSRR